jgi:hypothetical protein
MTLLTALRKEVTSRERMLTMGWSKRKDHQDVRTALGRAWVFLNSYPCANDERVKEWARKNMEDVRRIVASNRNKVFDKLVN